ncbi:12443_t:CDS:2 [Funneliformis geosporum]|uniref:12443_t:CDS:1 n=1 Tax=Funneliformis geosporum TaxID=1117311 RepID=A0A9W4WTE1_9GLOM|nr:12443_t:CDS:2 [Funneliformis geosporum]
MPKKDLSVYFKEHGFIIPNAEIYGGLAKSWDLGPQIITHPQVLEASGHLKNFHDWLIECRVCQKRYRLDNLIDTNEFLNFLEKEDKNNYQMKNNCSHCGKNDFHPPRQFNLLLSTNLEITDGKENMVYLRPETCQGIFVNFSAIQRSTRRQLPFGIGQIGKSFRNEITLHRGIFRTREFEQMELEFFCRGEEGEKWWSYWTEKAWNFLKKIIINDQEKIKTLNLKNEEIPHYAKKTQDLYFQYHFELSINGVIPEVIEVSFGVERLMLAILEDSYQEEEVENSRHSRLEKRQILKLPPLLAPYFLLKFGSFSVAYEEGDIGKSYRRQDAIGTYYCLTIDALTVEEFSADKPNPNYNTVTLRHRDTMKQEEKRININELGNHLNSRYQKFQFSMNQ